MKVKVSLLLLLAMAAALGYMLGTEGGRAQRDVILVKLGKGPREDAPADAPAAEDAADEPPEGAAAVD